MSPMAYPSPRFMGYSQHGQGTPKNVSIGATSALVLAASPARLYAQFNNNTGQVMWLSKGVPAVVGEGTRLAPGSMLTLTANELYTGAIYAITVGAPANLYVEEGI